MSGGEITDAMNDLTGKIKCDYCQFGDGVHRLTAPRLMTPALNQERAGVA
jgi:hypothetical protein